MVDSWPHLRMLGRLEAIPWRGSDHFRLMTTLLSEELRWVCHLDHLRNADTPLAVAQPRLKFSLGVELLLGPTDVSLFPQM